MPSHSSSSCAPSLPQTQAVAHEVVGRRTPTAESSSPVSWLNVDDLPEPVAPAIATTVWSAESRSRLGGALDDLLGLVDHVVVEPAPGRLGRRLEGLDPAAEVRPASDEPAGTLEQGRHRLPRRTRSSGGSTGWAQPLRD